MRRVDSNTELSFTILLNMESPTVPLKLARLIAEMAATRESTASAIWKGPPPDNISAQVRFCNSVTAAISGFVAFRVRRYRSAGVEVIFVDVLGEVVVVVAAALHGAPLNHQSE